MRNFEQRKTEIMNRSQQRIQKRKRARRNVISLCIPLVLCLSVCVGWLIPELKNVPEHFEELTQENGEYIPETYASMEDVTFGCAGQALVCVDGKEYTLEHPAYHDLDVLITNIRAVDDMDMLTPESSEREDEFISNYSSSDSSSPQITLTVSGADGTETVYSLSYMCLTDTTTGDTFALTQNEYQSLILLLELP